MPAFKWNCNMLLLHILYIRYILGYFPWSYYPILSCLSSSSQMTIDGIQWQLHYNWLLHRFRMDELQWLYCFGVLMCSLLIIIKQGAIILFWGISSLSRILIAALTYGELPQIAQPVLPSNCIFICYRWSLPQSVSDWNRRNLL